nr:hypothetical protein OG546_46855 [Streptomyces antimycoticus]
MREQPRDLLVSPPQEQAHDQHEIDDHPSLRQPLPPLSPAALRDHLVR